MNEVDVTPVDKCDDDELHYDSLSSHENRIAELREASKVLD
jgi:hypothetical protein